MAVTGQQMLAIAGFGLALWLYALGPAGPPYPYRSAEHPPWRL